MRKTFIINNEKGNASVLEYNPDCHKCHGQKMVRVSRGTVDPGVFAQPKLEWCGCVKKVEVDKMPQKLLFKCKACGKEEVREGSPADPCCRMCGGKMSIIGEAKKER